MQSVSNGSNLHEMSILFSGKNKKNKVFEFVKLSSAALTQRVVKVNTNKQKWY